MNTSLKERLLRIRWRILHFERLDFLRLLYKITRPASYPYISGDGFRRLARHVYDEKTSRSLAKRIREGEIVFVSTDHARQFFADFDPEITVRYRLITHNSDLPVDEALIAMAGSNVEAWYAQNCAYRHERVMPIPIGLENLHHYRAGVPGEFSTLAKRAGPRKSRVLASFSIGTSRDERETANRFASMSPCVDSMPARLTQDQYLRTAATYKFLLSPPGNGLDTHRTWEAMYLGVVPIVKDSVAMQSFAERGLPLWIMAAWDQLPSLTEAELERKYQGMKDRFRCPALWMDYWRELMHTSDGSSTHLELPDAAQVAGRRKDLQ